MTQPLYKFDRIYTRQYIFSLSYYFSTIFQNSFTRLEASVVDLQYFIHHKITKQFNNIIKQDEQPVF